MNADKTKYLARTKSGNLKDLIIEDYHFEAVAQFTYLGMVFSSTTDTTVAMQHRDAIMHMK